MESKAVGDAIAPGQILPLSEVAARLGVSASMLKLGFRSGFLASPDIPARAGYAVSGFTQTWIDKAFPIISSPEFKRLKYRVA